MEQRRLSLTPIEQHHHRFRAMGGLNEIVIECSVESDPQDAFTAAEHEVRRIEQKYSRYNTTSVTTLIQGNAGGTAVAVDAETEGLLNYADHCFKLSNGLFDITSGILRKAWNFSEAKLPEPELLSSLLRGIGWQRVERSPGFVRLPLPGMEIDFGGIGKEYAVDRAADELRRRGVEHGFVNLGGDVRVLGPRATGEPWSIGIQHPRDPRGTLASLSLSHGAVATSGDYERYVEINGKRYCHILNPKSGWPVEGLQSVSVQATSCLIAGSLSTVAMLLGPSRAEQFLQEAGAPFLICYEDGSVKSSSAE